MRIGFDMDDTTCSTTEKVIELEQDFSVGKKVKTKKDLWDAKRIRNVLTKIYKEVELKDGVVEAYNFFKYNYGDEINELFIISARCSDLVDNCKKLTEDYCKSNNLCIDHVIVNASDKAEVCKKYGIDLMIDNSINNYYNLINNGIEACLFDEYNNYPDIDDRIVSWYDVPKKFGENKKIRK